MTGEAEIRDEIARLGQEVDLLRGRVEDLRAGLEAHMPGPDEELAMTEDESPPSWIFHASGCWSMRSKSSPRPPVP